MSTLDLRRVRSFLALAEQGGFGAAAETLGISQPTLSAHIAALETELGVPLVSRTTRRMQLTTLGEKFLARARRAVEDLEHATDEIRDQASLERGRVIVACSRMLAAHALSAAVRILEQKFPGVIVQILDDLTPIVERAVAEREADFGVAPRPEHPALGFTHLTSEEFILVSPRASPLEGAAVSSALVAGGRLITMPAGSNIRRIIDQAFWSVGIRIQPKFEVRDHNTAIGMVQAGLGISLLPQTALSKDAAKTLHLSRLRDVKVSRDLGLIFLHGYKPTKSAAQLFTILRRVINQLMRA
ncbi:MAG TPA: LysR family transcriptional regulator [Xanthobacteraceae bacterium]|nr:LysR family transcriptional regulator [Xanthobacteraceae bacterium]